MQKQNISSSVDKKITAGSWASVLDAVSKSSQQSIVIVDKNGRIVYFNDVYARFIYSIQKRKINIDDLLLDYVNEEGKEIFSKNNAKAFNGITVTSEKEFISKDGEPIWYSICHAPVVNDGKVDFIMISMLDLTKIRMLENSLRENSNSLSESRHLGKLASFKMEYPYGQSSWSRETLSVLGIDFFGSPVNIYEFLHFVHPADKNKLISKIEDSISTKQQFQILFRFIKDENIKYLQMTGSIWHNEKNGKNYLSGNIMDMTDSKKAEEKVRNILMENEVLLKEIQHRVKNNFQVMLSLLNLQSRHIKDKEYSEIFKTTQNRIKTLAMVYDKLYHSKELSKVDFGEYVNQLIKNLIYAYNINMLKTAIKIEAENIPVDLKIAVPCGLIINELVSNALKFSLMETGLGEISVSIKEKENQIELVIKDKGKGLPEDLDFRSTETLGLQLVMLQVSQIDGLISYANENGAKFTITVPTKRIEPIENGEAIK